MRGAHPMWRSFVWFEPWCPIEADACDGLWCETGFSWAIATARCRQARRVNRLVSGRCVEGVTEREGRMRVQNSMQSHE